MGQNDHGTNRDALEDFINRERLFKPDIDLKRRGPLYYPSGSSSVSSSSEKSEYSEARLLDFFECIKNKIVHRLETYEDKFDKHICSHMGKRTSGFSIFSWENDYCDQLEKCISNKYDCRASIDPKDKDVFGVDQMIEKGWFHRLDCGRICLSYSYRK